MFTARCARAPPPWPHPGARLLRLRGPLGRSVCALWFQSRCARPTSLGAPPCRSTATSARPSGPLHLRALVSISLRSPHLPGRPTLPLDCCVYAALWAAPSARFGFNLAALAPPPWAPHSAARLLRLRSPLGRSICALWFQSRCARPTSLGAPLCRSTAASTQPSGPLHLRALVSISLRSPHLPGRPTLPLDCCVYAALWAAPSARSLAARCARPPAGARLLCLRGPVRRSVCLLANGPLRSLSPRRS